MNYFHNHCKVEIVSSLQCALCMLCIQPENCSTENGQSVDSGQWTVDSGWTTLLTSLLPAVPLSIRTTWKKNIFQKRNENNHIDPLSCLFYLLICPAQHICEIIRGNRIIIRRKEQTITGDINLSRGS